MTSNPQITPDGPTVRVTASEYVIDPGIGGWNLAGTIVSAWYRDMTHGINLEEVFNKHLVNDLPLYGVRLNRAIHKAEKAAGQVAIERSATLRPTIIDKRLGR